MTIPIALAPAGDAGSPEVTTVPLVDLQRQNEVVLEEVLGEIAACVRRGDLVLGEAVFEFERSLATAHQVAHAVGVGNGTDALELALRALGVGRGDEVILPANTFIATAEAVVRTRAQVVLVDCDPRHLLIDPAGVAPAVTSRTRAVIAVHLYGQAAPTEELQAAIGPDVTIVGDAAQAQGATRHGRSVMALGDAAATSFYPTKNLGAWGDAGAVLTMRAEVAAQVRALGNHGSLAKHEHVAVGTNSRLDTIQALVLRAKLTHLAGWNRQRQEAAKRYHDLLAEVPAVIRPSAAPGNGHVWHLYAIRVPASRRDDVLEALAQAGVGAGIHYAHPIHLHRAFAHLGLGARSFPVAEAASRELVSLPLFPGITSDQQERVAAVVLRCLA